MNFIKKLLGLGPLDNYKRIISIVLLAIAQIPGLNPLYVEILRNLGLSLGGVAIADVLVNKKSWRNPHKI